MLTQDVILNVRRKKNKTRAMYKFCDGIPFNSLLLKFYDLKLIKIIIKRIKLNKRI